MNMNIYSPVEETRYYNTQTFPRFYSLHERNAMFRRVDQMLNLGGVRPHREQPARHRESAVQWEIVRIPQDSYDSVEQGGTMINDTYEDEIPNNPNDREVETREERCFADKSSCANTEDSTDNDRENLLELQAEIVLPVENETNSVMNTEVEYMRFPDPDTQPINLIPIKKQAIKYFVSHIDEPTYHEYHARPTETDEDEENAKNYYQEYYRHKSNYTPSTPNNQVDNLIWCLRLGVGLICIVAAIISNVIKKRNKKPPVIVGQNLETSTDTSPKSVISTSDHNRRKEVRVKLIG